MIQRESYGEGFESYQDSSEGDDAGTVRLSIEALASLARGPRPFFLWVHLFGAHDRRTSRADDKELEYSDALRKMDAELASLLGAVDQLASRTPVATVVLADHGEMIAPNVRWHGFDLSDGLLHIPMLVRAPGFAAGRSSVLASSVDIAPTILALTQTPVPAVMQGQDLATARGPRGPIFSDTWLRSAGISLTAAFDGESKVVYSHTQRKYTSYSQLDAASPSEPLPLRRALEAYLRENELNFSESLKPSP